MLRIHAWVSQIYMRDGRDTTRYVGTKIEARRRLDSEVKVPAFVSSSHTSSNEPDTRRFVFQSNESVDCGPTIENYISSDSSRLHTLLRKPSRWVWVDMQLRYHVGLPGRHARPLRRRTSTDDGFSLISMRSPPPERNTSKQQNEKSEHDKCRLR